jgi:hypothetical protein
MTRSVMRWTARHSLYAHQISLVPITPRISSSPSPIRRTMSVSHPIWKLYGDNPVSNAVVRPTSPEISFGTLGSP